MSRASRAEVRALHRQMREWRRGRADTTLMQVLSDAYIAVFAVIMLGAMATSAILQTRVSISAGCTTSECGDARFWLAWVSALAVITATLAVARAFGPLQTSPAAASWLLSSPVDRSAVLRPRLLLVGGLTAVGTGLASAVIAELAGFGGSAVAVSAVAVAAGGVSTVMFAAIMQAGRGLTVRRLTWLLGTMTWLGLVLIAIHLLPSAPGSPLTGGLVGAGVAVLVWVLAAGLVARASSGLPTIHRDRLTPGGSLLASLSGALASLDLSLMYDIVIARRWLAKSTVRPVRGGPSGPWALVWRDVVRLRRSAASVLILVAALIVPYVVVALDLGEVVVVAGALAAFLAGVGLCSALRTTSRNPGLVRCFPMSAAQVRAACLAVPGAVLLAWALGAAPAVYEGMGPIPWPDAVMVSVAMGAAGITAIARWLMAAPPDYGRPLISSPAGGIPMGLAGSVLRGFDVLVLLVAPLLIAPSSNGATVSLALAAIVLAVLLRRK